MYKVILILLSLFLCGALQAEQTLSLIKPDAVTSNHIGRIIEKFERNGLSVVGLKMIRLSPARAGDFYVEHKDRPFYRQLVDYMSSGPIVAIILEGDNAVSRYRILMGSTDPKNAAPGTIRAEFAKSKSLNAVHGSDSPESAKREIAFFFKPDEIHTR